MAGPQTAPFGPSSSSSAESRITAFVSDLVRTEPIEEAFNLFLVHNKNADDDIVDKCSRWNALIAELQSDNSSSGSTNNSAIENALTGFVKVMSLQRNDKTLRIMRTILERSVGANVLKSRDVCDAVLTSDGLRADRNPAFWMTAFGLVRRIIGGVDYKGVREIMKAAIERLQTLSPGEIESVVSPQLSIVKDLLSYIFDRNAALLPGYFIVNEILKSYPDNPGWPHWAVVPMVSAFLNGFRPMTQMVTVVNRHRMRPIVEPTGKAHTLTTWRLDPLSLKFFLRGTLTYERTLPFGRDITVPQIEMLRYILRQNYSKDMVGSVLGIQKGGRKDGSGSTSGSQRYPMLEEQLVHLFVSAMTEEDETGVSDDSEALWRNLSSELIFSVLFQYITFPTFVTSVTEKLKKLKESQNHRAKELAFRRGRENMMWTLLQYVSGSISKNTTDDFVSVLCLIELLYSDEIDNCEPLPVPDRTKPDAVKKLAATALYIHFCSRAANEKTHPQFPLPRSLRKHYEYLSTIAASIPTSFNIEESVRKDFLVPIYCNTFTTKQEVFQQVMTGLVKAIGASNAVDTVPIPGGEKQLSAQAPSQPLSMDILDSLSLHTKMSLVHHIINFFQKQIHSKSTAAALSPALVETYCRLTVYSEIESLGVKSVLTQLFPQIFKESAWQMLHVILEIFSYRSHHIQASLRLLLLSHLNGLGGEVSTNRPIFAMNTQLSLCIESTALRIITSLGNSEIGLGKTGPAAASTTGVAGSKTGQQTGAAGSGNVVLYGDSEELNRVVVLTMARALQVNGLDQQSVTWVKDTLNGIMQKTPHSWPSHTLVNFPQIMQDFFKENPGPRENTSHNRAQLKQKVEEEYAIWASSAAAASETERIAHFSSPNNSFFLCVIWKFLIERETVLPLTYRVLERIGYKHLIAHLRTFCELLIFEFSKSGGAGFVAKCIESINNLIWKYNIIALDRFILCMALRTNEGSEAQVCLFIIQLLLLKPTAFRDRLNYLVELTSVMNGGTTEHQLATDFHQVHLDFYKDFPERFTPGELGSEAAAGGNGGQAAVAASQQPFPIYFSNVCVRFIPVFDIVVHRFLECPKVHTSLVNVLGHLSYLYKFHQKPITFLYNTLHYFERRIRENPFLKKKLIYSITGALKDVRPEGWGLTPPYLDYLESEHKSATSTNANGDLKKLFPPAYFVRLVGRLTHSLQNADASVIKRRAFPVMDWRFNEFPNEGAHATYITCVEIMGLPGMPHEVGAAILDVVLECAHVIPREELPDWINALGILMSNLPEAYWDGLYDKLVSAINEPPLSQWNVSGADPFKVFNFSESATASDGTDAGSYLSHLLAIAHSVFHHSGFDQIQTLPDLVREKFNALVRTEEQLLFVIHVTGPFLQRLHAERYMRPLFDLAVQYYRMLAKVDKELQRPLRYMDTICDLLYHVKYQFTGDSIRLDVERIEKELSPPLQLRLRFIAPKL